MYYNAIKNKSLASCLKNGVRDLWTHSSTAIEGNTLSLGETSFVLNEGLTISGKTVREHNEIIGHARAIELLYDFVAKDTPMTERAICDLHKATLLNPPLDTLAPIGRWKVESNFTQQLNHAGKIVYKEYPTPKEIPALMEKWLSLFASIQPEEPLMQYCKLHITFGAIHPFADGNGRLARLLANLPILKSELVPITISNESRKEYISLLQNTNIDDALNVTNGFQAFVAFAENEWEISRELYQQAVQKSVGET